MQRTKAERIQAETMAKVRHQPNVRLTGRTPLLRDVLVIMQDTGLRPDEVLKMRWEHIDWLQKTASNPSGKTERARRVVPISERVLSILGQRRTDANQGWVFPSPKKDSRTGHFSLSTVEHQLVYARTKLDCQKHWCSTAPATRMPRMP